MDSGLVDAEFTPIISNEHRQAAQKLAGIVSSLVRTFAQAQFIKAQATVDDVAQGFGDNLGDLIQELLRGGRRLSKADFRRDMKKLVKDWAKQVFEVGWEEGGGDVADVESDDLALLEGFVSEQQGFVNEFSDWLTDKESDLDAVPDRVALWASSMANLGQQAKARAMGDPVGEWEYGDTEHCDTCLELNGQRHRVSWYVKRDYNPRTPGAAMDCGGYRCQCQVKHVKTGERLL